MTEWAISMLGTETDEKSVNAIVNIHRLKLSVHVIHITDHNLLYQMLVNGL